MKLKAVNAGGRFNKNLCFVFLLSFVSCLFVFPTAISAQLKIDDDRPKNLVPPPISVLSKDEKKKLRAVKTIRERTKLALAFMNVRLTKSELLTKERKFSLTLIQLGRFDALLKDTMRFLNRYKGNRKSFKNFKRLEMSLRKFTPRLELIRRETPDRYGYHVKQLVRSVRKARSKAIAPLFGDTVLPEGSK